MHGIVPRRDRIKRSAQMGTNDGYRVIIGYHLEVNRLSTGENRRICVSVLISPVDLAEE